MWSHADLVEHVTSSRVAEDVVLKYAKAPGTYAFTVTGATPRRNTDCPQVPLCARLRRRQD
jgi:hypothetical protein